jgi:serine/threonine-protein kinase RsbW
VIPAPSDEELPVSSSRSAVPVPGVIGLRVPGTLAYRHLAVRLVTTACRVALGVERADTSDASDVDDDFTHEVVSAFGEAFNNIALHGYRDVTPGAIHIEVEWDEDRLVIVVLDTGRTFDLDSVSLPDLDAMQESGMGVFIMRSCMDEIDYRPGPPNVLRLVKLRRTGTAVPERPSGEIGGGLPPEGGDRDAALEQSAWRMKAIPGQRWGLGEVTTGGAPVPPEADERKAEGSRRR